MSKKNKEYTFKRAAIKHKINDFKLFLNNLTRDDITGKIVLNNTNVVALQLRLDKLLEIQIEYDDIQLNLELTAEDENALASEYTTRSEIENEFFSLSS